MVFKKPYAFLIKYFRIIHLLLSAIILFIILKFSPISRFFSAYANGSIQPGSNLTSQYIDSLIYLAILMVIAFAGLMFWLMFKKKKPVLFYILTLANYLMLFIFVIIAAGVMQSLESGGLTQQAARTYRDLFFIVSLPQYYFVLMSLIRGFGFDVKKFNFNKDLAELEIKSEDSEEFEFVLGNDIYLYERKARRTLREIKYYILENKLIFGGICAVVGVLIIGYLIINVDFTSLFFKAGKSTTMEGFSYRINSSYITSYDYNGNLIKKDKKYVIVNITVTNVMVKPASIPTTSLYLTYGNNSAYNQPSLRNNFIDVGKAYISETLSPNVSRDLLFIFEIASTVNSKNFTLKVLKEITYDENNQAKYNYADFKINPKVLNKEPSRIARKTNELLYLGEALYQDSNLIITNVELMNKYEYQYESCNEDKCKTYYGVVAPTDAINNKILIVSYKLQMHPKIGLLETMGQDHFFFDKYLKVEYNYNGQLVARDVTVRTYPALKNKVFIDISKVATGSNVFNVAIKTRDYHYYIDCKNL